MPAENEFEKSMQQLLDGLRVEPAPSDWQAVHEKLHPQKKRRSSWWWLPILASLVVAGLWMRNDPTGSGQARLVHADKQTTSTHIETAVNNEVTTNNNLRHNKNELQTQQMNDNSIIAGTDGKASSGSIRQQPADDLQHTSQSHTDFIANNQQATNRHATENTELKVDHATSVTAEMELSKTSSGAKQDSGKKQAVATSSTIESRSKAGDATITPETNPIAVTKASLHTDTPAAVQPIPKAPAKWKWLLYGGVGINITGEPINMLKAASDYATGGSGGSILIAQNEITNGFHTAAGVLVERHWTKNWKLQTGIGLSYGTWSGSSQLFRDSVNAGTSFYSRTMISDQQSSYQLFMFELPLQIHNRFAGKNSTTWWWTAGINNQFLLDLKAHTTRQNFNQNFSTVSDEKSLTSAANFYQPQIRLGFLLDHAGAKTHWQLAPLFNYSLPSVYKSSSDNLNLLNLQLQYRLYLGKLK